jgi:hypothetical protein
MINTKSTNNKDYLQRNNCCSRTIEGKIIPFKRIQTYNSCKYPAIMTSGACSRKIAYSLNTLEKVELVTSIDDCPTRKELGSFFENKKDQVVESLKDLLAISQQIRAIDKNTKERFRKWLKKVELQLINDLYETSQNPRELDDNDKNVKAYQSVGHSAMTEKEGEMFALPTCKPALHSAESVWRQARRLKVKNTNEKVLSNDVIIEIDFDDNDRVKFDNTKVNDRANFDNTKVKKIIYDLDTHSEVIDVMINNCSNELPVIYIEPIDFHNDISYLKD